MYNGTAGSGESRKKRNKLKPRFLRRLGDQRPSQRAERSKSKSRFLAGSLGSGDGGSRSSSIGEVDAGAGNETGGDDDPPLSAFAAAARERRGSFFDPAEHANQQRVLKKAESVARLNAHGLGGAGSGDAIDLVSDLRDIEEQNQDRIEELEEKVAGLVEERDAALRRSEMLASLNSSAKEEAEQYKEKLARNEALYGELMKKMASKTLSEVDNWKERARKMEEQNRELGRKMERQTSQRERLTELQRGMDDAAREAGDMSKKLADFTESHEVAVKGYQEKVAELGLELRKARSEKEELTQKQFALEDEMRLLGDAFGEAQDFYDKQIIELKAENEAFKYEKDEAYKMCDKLREEMKLMKGENGGQAG